MFAMHSRLTEVCKLEKQVRETLKPAKYCSLSKTNPESNKEFTFL